MKPRTTAARRILCTTLLTCLIGGRAALGDNWPEFRGPDGTGTASATLPLEWSETINVAWKTPIHGKAWSSPVIWGDQVWLTSATEDGRQMFALCVDLASGQIVRDIKLWEIEKPQFCYPFNSYASSTPVLEAGRLYAHFGSHGTACLDTVSGKVLWTRRDLPCNHHRGAGSSPILAGDLLILTFDGFDQQYVAALDKKTGRTVWKRNRNIDYGTDNGDAMKAYVTPSVIESGGRRELVSTSAGATIAYDPETGDELWRVRSGGMNAATRPQFAHGLVYCTTEGGFHLFAVRPGGTGDVTESHVAWTFNRSVPSRPTPLVVGDYLYMVSDRGVATCVNAESGESVWQERLGGEFSASPVAASGRIYFFAEDGATPVVAAEPEFKLLATNHLDAGFMASPAIAGKALILRTKTHLYRVEDADPKAR